MANIKKYFSKMKQISHLFIRTLNILTCTSKSSVFIIIFCTIITGISPSISVIIMQKIIDTLQLHNNFVYLVKLLCLYVTLDLINGVIIILLQYVESVFQSKVAIDINRSILEKVKWYSLKNFEDSETYNLMRRAMNVGSVRIFSFFKSFVLVFQHFINILMFSTILFSWKWWLVPLVIIVPIVNMICLAYFGNKQFQVKKKRAEKERKQSYFQFLLTNDIAFKEIKLFELGDYFRNSYNNLAYEFFNQDRNILNKKTMVSTFLFVFEQIVSVFLFVYIIVKTYAGELLLSGLITFTRSISNVKSSTQLFLSYINAIYENVLYINQYFDFIDKKGDLELSIENEKHQNVTDSVNFHIPSIEINNLSYKYKGQDKLALKNINLKIDKNNLVAFIGTNGSGKSTLVKILSTLYQDYQGDIFFGDMNLKELDQETVKNKIGVLFQDFVKYEFTARENIAFGQLTKMDDSDLLLNIIKKVGLESKINRIDMQLGYWFDDGIQLSGGEWLKIALGRAFIRDADIYLLDEPNAALDPVAERHILQSFKEICDGKIGIIISHRISSIINIVDNIVVFNNGSIEAIGTHEELLANSSTYKNMFLSETSISLI